MVLIRSLWKSCASSGARRKGQRRGGEERERERIHIYIYYITYIERERVHEQLPPTNTTHVIQGLAAIVTRFSSDDLRTGYVLSIVFRFSKQGTHGKSFP